MKVEQAFGHVLKRARLEKGLSQEKLALLCDLDRTFISLLERGLRQPSLATVIVLSKVLEVPASELVESTVNLLS